MHSISILWGEAPEPGDEAITYEFKTEAELKAFLEGVDAADGWMTWRDVPAGTIVPPSGWKGDI